MDHPVLSDYDSFMIMETGTSFFKRWMDGAFGVEILQQTASVSSFAKPSKAECLGQPRRRKSAPDTFAS
jgi:hypothetical protein